MKAEMSLRVDTREEGIALLEDGFKIEYDACRFTLPSETGRVDTTSHSKLAKADDYPYDNGWHRLVRSRNERGFPTNDGYTRERIEWEHVKAFQFVKDVELDLPVPELPYDYEPPEYNQPKAVGA